MIAAIDTINRFTLGDNLITSHHVDCIFTALIPAETVDQERIISSSNNVGNISH